TGERRVGVATAVQHQGKELSYNNINDTDAAYELVAEFDPAMAPAVAIIKHANPCGVATGISLADAYRKALRADPLSAFGGVIALNRPLDAEAAAEIVKIFTEVIIAPALTVRTVAGGLLVQDRDSGMVTAPMLKTVTRRAPTEEEVADLLFAWKV